MGKLPAGTEECFHVGILLSVSWHSFTSAPTSKRFHYSYCCNRSYRPFFRLMCCVAFRNGYLKNIYIIYGTVNILSDILLTFSQQRLCVR
jgi:hypothetical protein